MHLSAWSISPQHNSDLHYVELGRPIFAFSSSAQAKKPPASSIDLPPPRRIFTKKKAKSTSQTSSVKRNASSKEKKTDSMKISQLLSVIGTVQSIQPQWHLTRTHKSGEAHPRWVQKTEYRKSIQSVFKDRYINFLKLLIFISPDKKTDDSFFLSWHKRYSCIQYYSVSSWKWNRISRIKNR